MDHAKLIDALGGYERVALALKCDRSRPHRWKTTGIPVQRWPAILELAKAKRLRVTAHGLLRHAPHGGVADAAMTTHGAASHHPNGRGR